MFYNLKNTLKLIHQIIDKLFPLQSRRRVILVYCFGWVPELLLFIYTRPIILLIATTVTIILLLLLPFNWIIQTWFTVGTYVLLSYTGDEKHDSSYQIWDESKPIWSLCWGQLYVEPKARGVSRATLHFYQVKKTPEKWSVFLFLCFTVPIRLVSGIPVTIFRKTNLMCRLIIELKPSSTPSWINLMYHFTEECIEAAVDGRSV